MRKLMVIATGVLFVSVPAWAEIPQVIGYQGKVLDNVGSLVPDGDYVMQFRIWNDATGGSLLWDSGEATESVEGGVFNVMLGEAPHPPLNLEFDEDYWLEVTFDGEPMSPRRQFGSSGYAFMASGLVAGTEVAGGVSGGAAIKASNTASSGTAYGLYGQSYSTEGVGVLGFAAAASGTTFGVYGKANTGSGYAGYFDGHAKVTGGLETTGFQMPTGAADGYFLVSDGSGHATWTDVIPGTDDGDWSFSGDNIYRDTGNVGIGTQTPGTLLHLNTSDTGDIFKIRSTGATADLLIGADDATGARAYVATGGGDDLTLGAGDRTDDVFIESSNGNVGVGTTSPDAKLHTVTDVTTAAVKGISTATTGESYGLHGESESTIGKGVRGYATAGSGPTVGVDGRSDSPDGKGVHGYAFNGEGVNYGVYGKTNSTDGYGVYSSGNAKVNGNLEVAGFSMPTGAADGYFLVSDGSGNGTWTEAGPGTDDGDWSFSGDDIYREPGNVGIGTSTPTRHLDVRGDIIGTYLRVGDADANTKAYLTTLGADTVRFDIENQGDSFTLRNRNASGILTDRIFLQPTTGNVGIGTANPGRPLEVDIGSQEYGLRVTSSNLLQFQGLSILNTARTAGTQSNVNFRFHSNGSTSTSAVRGINIGGDTDFRNELEFSVMNASGAEVKAMRIDCGGNVGIGTMDPGARLSVMGLSNTSSYSGVRIDASTGNLYIESSSKRYKDDIRVLETDFDRILEAKPKTFIDKTSGERNIGYIAEEFADLGLQELVTYCDGKPEGLKYELVPLYLLEIIKEMRAELESQKAENEAVRARLEALEAKLH